MANVGFCQSKQWTYWGSTDWAGFGPYVIIPSLCVGVSLWQQHQLRPLCLPIQWPIYSLQGRRGPRNRNKLIHTSPSPVWLAWHFSNGQKKAFYSVENLEKSLVSMVMVQLKQPWAIKLQSDVNLGCSQPHREKAVFTQQTQIKQFVCQFTCHLNEFLLVSSLFKWRELQTIIDL